MIVYMGGVKDLIYALEKFGKYQDFKPRNFLASFCYPDQIKTIETRHSEFDNIFIDSGAFSFMFSKFKGVANYWKEPGYKEYLEKYATWLHANKDKITVYANLDVIGRAKETYESQLEMEKMGLRPLPVFHLTDDTFQYFEKYLENYDYIAIGGAVKVGGEMTSDIREETFKKIFEMVRSIRPDVKLHAFGITSMDFLKKFEFYSCDSVAWVMAAGYGQALFLQEDKTISLRMSNRSLFDPKSENKLSDYEWIAINKVIEKLGFTMEQVMSVIYARRIVNAQYYLDLESYLTEYYESVRNRRIVQPKLF